MTESLYWVGFNDFPAICNILFNCILLANYANILSHIKTFVYLYRNRSYLPKGYQYRS